MTGPVVAIIALAVAGMPLFCVLGAVGLIGMHHSGTPLSGALADVYRLAGAEAVSLSTIPLFTFAGYLMTKAKTAQRLVRMAEALFGWIPGGLAAMTVVTMAFFTVFTGASGVTIVALGGILLPELERTGYPKRFALGVVTGSGAIGLLFPPALPLIVYAIIFALTAGHASDAGAPVDFSIERFLTAGILPGILLVAIVATYCIIRGWRAHVPRTPLDLKKFGKAFWEAKWELPIPFFIIGLMMFGLATIPEVAALTALYVFVIEVFVYKEISIKRDLFSVSRESMTLVGAIFMKIAAATILTAYFVDAEVPERLFTWMSQYVHSSWAFLMVLNVLLLLVGCLMDIFSAIVVVVPLIVPAAAQFHINPYHLGVIFLLNLEIGYLLPPAGLNLFIAAFRFNRPITDVYRAVVPFILLMIVALGIVTAAPTLSTALPNWLAKHAKVPTAQPAEPSPVEAPLPP
ncbi:MAG TPA: TRAP transporter large permease subunit [Polyangia bacterium]|nr:TRAP transporter large permease subunit [Polyangia bacterium]